MGTMERWNAAEAASEAVVKSTAPRFGARTAARNPRSDRVMNLRDPGLFI